MKKTESKTGKTDSITFWTPLKQGLLKKKMPLIEFKAGYALLGKEAIRGIWFLNRVGYSEGTPATSSLSVFMRKDWLSYYFVWYGKCEEVGDGDEEK